MPPRKTPTVAQDTVTILKTTDGKLATKQIVKNTSTGKVEFVQFDAGYLFQALPNYPVRDIRSLSDLLTALEGMPEFFVIRGEPVDPAAAEQMLMLRRGSGQGTAFTGNFRTPDLGRRYVLIDVDKLSLPSGMSLTQQSVGIICEYVVGLLPQEFHDASYHWQLSSSAGFGDPSRVSLHLWFWLVQPVADLDLRRWGKFVNEKSGLKLVDTALFSHVQPHYTAAPVFNGVKDPFPARSALVKKLVDSVDLVLPPAKQQAIGPRIAGYAVGCKPCKGFENHLKRIGDHPGGDGFHAPLRDAAASYVGSNGVDGTDREALYALLAAAVYRADRSRHDDVDVQRRASREHIMPLIDSALAKFGDSNQSAARKSKFYGDIGPHFQSQPMSVEAIQAELLNLLPSARSFNVRDSS